MKIGIDRTFLGLPPIAMETSANLRANFGNEFKRKAAKQDIVNQARYQPSVSFGESRVPNPSLAIARTAGSNACGRTVSPANRIMWI